MAKPRRPAAPAACRVLIASGVNLDLLGRREPEIYGSASLADVERLVRGEASALAPSLSLEFFQTNDEAALLAKLDEGWDGVVLNPGAWTHTSLALADRLRALALPYVEVHVSNVAAREEFRRHSYTAAGAVGVVHGLGIESYLVGLYGLVRRLGLKG